MTDEATSQLIIELSKNFMSLLENLAAGYERGYFRFRQDRLRFGSNASYSAGSEVKLIGAIQNSDFYHAMNQLGHSILRVMERDEGVFLLSVDNTYNYDIQFDWSHLDRWEISKLNGGTGIPAGV